MLLLYFISFLISPLLISSLSTYYMDDYCYHRSQVVPLSLEYTESILLAATQSVKYKPNQNCTASIIAPQNHGIIVNIRKIDFVNNSSRCNNFIEINGTLLGSVKICKEDDSSFYSEGREIKIRYQTDEGHIYKSRAKGFEVLLTSFRYGKCSLLEYRCQNSRCISSLLRCNELNNCGDSSDERDCDLETETETVSPIDFNLYDPAPSQVSKYLIGIFSVGAACLFLAGVVIFWRRNSTTTGVVVTRNNSANCQPIPLPYQTIRPPPYSICQTVAPGNLYSGTINQQGALYNQPASANNLYPTKSAAPKI